jgi:hypothetical protein
MARETVSSLVGDQGEKREEILMGGRLFQSDVYCETHHTRQRHEISLSWADQTRHILVLSKTYKESCNSTSRSEILPSFIYVILLNLSIASKQIKRDEMLKA